MDTISIIKPTLLHYELRTLNQCNPSLKEGVVFNLRESLIYPVKLININRIRLYIKCLNLIHLFRIYILCVKNKAVGVKSMQAKRINCRTNMNN